MRLPISRFFALRELVRQAEINRAREAQITALSTAWYLAKLFGADVPDLNEILQGSGLIDGG